MTKISLKTVDSIKGTTVQGNDNFLKKLHPTKHSRENNVHILYIKSTFLTTICDGDSGVIPGSPKLLAGDEYVDEETASERKQKFINVSQQNVQDRPVALHTATLFSCCKKYAKKEN